MFVNNYTWFGVNRRDLDPRAVRGSGGIGFLVKDELLECYTVTELGSSFDGIYWLKLVNKFDDTCSVYLCSCCLPPERSSRGNIAQEYFDPLLTDMYTFMGDSPVLLCGDFNARISDKSDFIDSLDSVSKRTHLDTSSNSHGENFIDFLKDSCCYVLNGLFDATNDNYTCISQRGKSVVDYMVCSGSTFSKISDFRVMTMTDVIDGLNLISTISERSKPSDHSVLCCTLEMSSYDLLRREPNNRDQPTSKSVIRKYNVETIPK